MKKTFIAMITIAIVTLTSCQKERTCEITTTVKATGQVIKTNADLPKSMSHSDQKAWCKAQETETSSAIQTSELK